MSPFVGIKTNSWRAGKIADATTEGIHVGEALFPLFLFLKPLFLECTVVSRELWHGKFLPKIWRQCCGSWSSSSEWFLYLLKQLSLVAVHLHLLSVRFQDFVVFRTLSPAIQATCPIHLKWHLMAKHSARKESALLQDVISVCKIGINA